MGLATLRKIVAVMFLNMLFIDIVYNNQYDSIQLSKYINLKKIIYFLQEILFFTKIFFKIVVIHYRFSTKNLAVLNDFLQIFENCSISLFSNSHKCVITRKLLT